MGLAASAAVAAPRTREPVASAQTVHPDGTGSFVGEGLTWFGFGPISQGNTGEPGLVFTSGLVAIQFGGGVVTSFALAGERENGCELLTSRGHHQPGPARRSEPARPTA